MGADTNSSAYSDHAHAGTIVIDRGDHGSSVVLDEASNRGVATVLDGKELDAKEGRRFAPGERVAITSENVLDTVLKRLEDPALADMIDALKNKNRCRDLMNAQYPDFFHRLVALSDLPTLKLPPDRKFVVKPNRGYFATAIKIINSDSDLAQIRKEIEADVKRNSAVFASTVLSDADVIVEDFIEGEEYAVDMFFDRSGKPVIVNIYHHPIPENPDYLHALYYTSKPIFDDYHDLFIGWFEKLNETLNARGFPVHGEFRVTRDGVMPIELNPLRFGGDGLIDLAFHAFGFNPYQAFVRDEAPDWNAIWKGREEKIYTWMMGYVGTDIDVQSHRPDRGAFESLFSNILSDALLNYEAHLGFSVVYSEETDIETVHRLVNTDFKEFFLGAEAFSEQALSELYRSGVLLHLKPGERIWEEGDVGDYALLVIEGSVEVLHPAAETEVLLDTIGPQMVVGEYAVMDGRPRSASARVGPDGCTAMRITGEAFRKLLRDAPGLFEELYWQQQMRIRKMNRRIADLEAALAAAGQST